MEEGVGREGFSHKGRSGDGHERDGRGELGNGAEIRRRGDSHRAQEGLGSTKNKPGAGMQGSSRGGAEGLLGERGLRKRKRMRERPTFSRDEFFASGSESIVRGEGWDEWRLSEPKRGTKGEEKDIRGGRVGGGEEQERLRVGGVNG
ncbi:hypothetical protein AMTR_s00048p00207390 [Amborella trichopoda]|uniref:Uncharacterized protein n=1 Tax=Amborella trichopoda TaxID=13333 RepID=U5D5N9_AMBTC|nr:hypothetical protein AMTR_s00048p00207390 [Amborella trichopoda]